MKRSVLSIIAIRTYAVEILLFIGIIAAYCVTLSHIQQTEWKDMFFLNADILTLPLVMQSLYLHEPFQWVFSSQIFIFPEGPIYLICSLFSSNFKVALIINGLVNISLFYLLLRILAKVVTDNTTYRRIFAALFTLGILLLISIESRDRDLNIATYFLMTSVYYGTIIASLLALTSSLSLYKRIVHRHRRSLQLALWCIGFVTSLLATVSNPLFFIQFTVPFLIVISILYLLKYLPLRVAFIMISPYITSLIIALLMRSIALAGFFSSFGSLNQYIHFNEIILTIKKYRSMVASMYQGGIERQIEMTIIFLIVFCAVAVSIYIIIARLRRTNSRFIAPLTPQDSIVILFATISPLITLLVTIVTGNALTRYLLPVVFFTPLVFLPLYHFARDKRRWIIRYGAAAIVSFVIIAAIISRPFDTMHQLTSYYPADAACVDKALSKTPHRVGVAQYWRARSLQLNSHDGHILLQASGTMQKFGWLYNNAAYNIYTPSYVIVDKPEQNHSPDVSNDPGSTITKETVITTIGPPSHLYHCDSFDIYTYDKNTPGNATLREILHGQPAQR